MTQEQPLVTLKEIAAYLKVSERTAKRLLDKIKVPTLEAYMPLIAVYPFTLRKYMERYKKVH